ncbi:MAG: HesA/MoeB/ThiF family protein [Solirubrobacterales bacterium]
MTTTFAFSYEEMISRNAGFLSATEQELLHDGRVFVCGVGGMGGAALQALVRAGVGNVAIADMDVFERSNLNRQVFATMDTVGKLKVGATADALARINPTLGITTYGGEWVEQLDEILSVYPVVINGMDDLAAGLALYRKARQRGATVIDAYTAPLPSVTVVRPTDPRPEERLRFPTTGTNWRVLTNEEVDACKGAEALYVMVNSNSAKHIDLHVAAELMAGKRSRPSFAPMVITTGTLMASEAIKVLIGRDTVDCRGVFLNPWTMRIERPKPAPVAWVLERMARRYLNRILARVS